MLESAAAGRAIGRRCVSGQFGEKIRACFRIWRTRSDSYGNPAQSPPDGFVRTTSEIDFKKTAAERITLSAAVFVVMAIPHKDCATDASSNFSSDETKSGVNT